MDDVSVLLLLSNCGPLRILDCATACTGAPAGRLPVSNIFLKLSTSSEALLLPSGGLSTGFRSSPDSLCCGSIDANVREKGFAGTPLGDMYDCGAWNPRVEPAMVSAAAIASPRPSVSVSGCPADVSPAVEFAGYA